MIITVQETLLANFHVSKKKKKKVTLLIFIYLQSQK